MSIPVPENVRLMRKDTGEILPVELVYKGWDSGIDCHVWCAVPTSPHMSPDMTLLCDMLPASTSIELEYEGEL